MVWGAKISPEETPRANLMIFVGLLFLLDETKESYGLRRGQVGVYGTDIYDSQKIPSIPVNHLVAVL